MLRVRLGFALFGMFWGTWAVAALDIQQFLGLSDAELGLLVAATVVGTSVTNVVGGALAERHGLASGHGRGADDLGAARPRRRRHRARRRVDARVPRRRRRRRPARRHPEHRVDRAARRSPGPAAAGARLLQRRHGRRRGGDRRGARGRIGRGAGRSPSPASPALALAAAVHRRPATSPSNRTRRASTSRCATRSASCDAAGCVRLAVVFALGAMVEGGIGTFGVLYLRDQLEVAVLAGAGAYVVGQSLATITRFALGRRAGRAPPRGHRTGAPRARPSRPSGSSWRRRPTSPASPPPGWPSRRSARPPTGRCCRPSPPGHRTVPASPSAGCRRPATSASSPARRSSAPSPRARGCAPVSSPSPWPPGSRRRSRCGRSGGRGTGCHLR